MKVLKENNCQLEFYTQQKILPIGEIKAFSDKKKPGEFLSNIPTLKETHKGIILQAEVK